MAQITSVLSLASLLGELNQSASEAQTMLPLGLAFAGECSVECARVSRAFNVVQWGRPLVNGAFDLCPLAAKCPALSLCRLYHCVSAEKVRFHFSACFGIVCVLSYFVLYGVSC